MARKKKENTPVVEETVKANIIGAGEVVSQQITSILVQFLTSEGKISILDMMFAIGFL